jgi:hypothetical protein
MKVTTQLTWSRIRTIGAWLACSMLVAIPIMGRDTGKTQQQLKATLEAHQGEFDYLLGDWQFTANSKQFGPMKGYWSAVKLGDGGQVLDEFRVVGDKGQTFYSSLTVRVYNPYLERWELVTLDKRDGLQNFGTARREGPEMVIEQKFGAVTPQPSLWHIRYHNIQADYFSWSADRSEDDGKTWQKDFQTIEAKRIGPPRTMEPLTTGHKTTASVLR